MYIEAVHRAERPRAVVTNAITGPRPAGFDADWRIIELLTTDGDLSKRCEIFDEADLDAALARFEELGRPTSRLENAASQVYERFWTYFEARDWDAMAAALDDDIFADDRRRVVNVGIRRGRDDRYRGPPGSRRPWDQERDLDRHRDPWGTPRPLSRSGWRSRGVRTRMS